MGSLDGRVAVITGGGRGLGREYALYFAEEGARVVLSGRKLANRPDGQPTVEDVAAEIRAKGGDAVHDYHDPADWAGGRQLVRRAVETFGNLDIVVNNAGNLRDAALPDMTEDEWDSVINVHLKSTFVMTRFAGAYWRDQTQAGQPVAANIVNTTSRVALLARPGGIRGGGPGSANYATAKGAITTFTEVSAGDLAPYGVRVNCIAPSARSGMTAPYAGLAQASATPGTGEFDQWDPRNVCPMVAWLSTACCPVTGRVYWVKGGTIGTLQSWSLLDTVETCGQWTVDELQAKARRLAYLPEVNPALAGI